MLQFSSNTKLKVSNATKEDKEGQRSVKEVKEIHTMVKNALIHNHILLFSSTENRPGFVHLLQQKELGDFNGDLHSLQA